jgi:hypothetical protein
LSDQRIGSLQAAEPDKGSAAFLFLTGQNSPRIHPKTDATPAIKVNRRR